MFQKAQQLAGVRHAAPLAMQEIPGGSPKSRTDGIPMRKFLYRCFQVCSLIATCVFLAVFTVGYLACSQPGFYAKATAQPITQADIDAAVKEIEEIGQSLEVFIQLGDADLDELQAVRKMAEGMRDANGKLPDHMKQLDKLPSQEDLEAMGDTFDVTLKQRHINAWIIEEMGSGGKDWRLPHIDLQADKIRYGVSVATPAGEVVLSCDFQLAKTDQTNLTLELHAVRCGKLPLPAITILKQYMKTNPRLPDGIEINVQGERPTVTFTKMPQDGKIQLSSIEVAEGEVHLSLILTKREAKAVAAM